MSNTYKDRRNRGNVIEVVQQSPKMFELRLNNQLVKNELTENQLAYEPCSRWGYCQGDFEPIMDELIKIGRATLHM